MRVLLEVETGPAAGHRRVLRAGDSLEVGRSGLVDFAFEDDLQMSARHFRIMTTADQCHIEDLDSSNGTQVNGQPIVRQSLRDQDTIAAGGTRFTLHLEGAVEPSSPQTPDSDEVSASTVDQTSTVDPVPAIGGSVELEPCKGGMPRYRGAVETAQPAALAEKLSQRFQQIVVVGVQDLEEPQIEQLGEAPLLFDWLPKDLATPESPRLVCDSDVVSRAQIVQQRWGTDSIVSLYIAKDQELPMVQVRRCAGAFIRPSLLRPMLSETVAEVVADLLKEISLVLVEDETPDSWLMFSENDLTPLLSELGLSTPEPVESPEPTESSESAESSAPGTLPQDDDPEPNS